MNRVHPTAIIDPAVRMGLDNHFGPYCVIGPNVTIGSNNRFEAYCSIGSPAEKINYFEKHGEVSIGSNNIFREFVTVNAGTFMKTIVGNKVIMLKASHVGHDCVIEDDVTISCGVLVGGESMVLRGANLGLGSVIHQRSIIGAFSMLGMNSTVTKTTKIRPGLIYAGCPAKYLKQNKIGLQRFNITDLELNEYNKLFDDLTK